MRLSNPALRKVVTCSLYAMTKKRCHKIYGRSRRLQNDELLGRISIEKLSIGYLYVFIFPEKCLLRRFMIKQVRRHAKIEVSVCAYLLFGFSVSFLLSNEWMFINHNLEMRYLFFTIISISCVLKPQLYTVNKSNINSPYFFLHRISKSFKNHRINSLLFVHRQLGL